MSTLAVSDFKQKCLELLEPDKLRFDPIHITRHNKVVAVVTSPDNYLNKEPMKGTVTYHLGGEALEDIRFTEEWGSN